MRVGLQVYIQVGKLTFHLIISCHCHPFSFCSIRLEIFISKLKIFIGNKDVGNIRATSLPRISNCGKDRWLHVLILKESGETSRREKVRETYKRNIIRSMCKNY